jgi:ribose transport system ATP-binding protein
VRCLFGLDAVKNGTVKVSSFTGRATPHQRWKEGMGMLSEDRKNEGLALNLSIADNMSLTKLEPIVAERKLEGATAEWIKRASIKCREPGQVVGELSGGNQQKVAFARLLYHDVDVLLLDEPTRGIDVGSKQQIYQMIDSLAKSGKAVIMVSSYLPELLGVCDRIAVMSRGVLGQAREVGELDQETIMREATGV